MLAHEHRSRTVRVAHHAAHWRFFTVALSAVGIIGYIEILVK